MRRIAKFSLRLAILAGLGFLGYALFADLPAPVREVRVTLRGPAPGSDPAPAPVAAEAPAPAPLPSPTGPSQAPTE